MAFVSKGGRRIGKLKNDVRNFNLEQRRKVNATARSVAVQIMNDLAKAGPEWSGEFKNSWEAVALGEGSKIGKSGSFPYKIGNIPRLSTEKGEISFNAGSLVWNTNNETLEVWTGSKWLPLSTAQNDHGLSATGSVGEVTLKLDGATTITL